MDVTTTASHLLLVKNASQVVQVCRNREEKLTGSSMNELAVLNAEGSEGLSVAVGRDGNILCIGKDSEVSSSLTGCEFEEIIDAGGYSVIPGLVDGHTHPVWVGDRVNEFAMKLAGASYMDIHAQGGGIHFTVQCVREATPSVLYDSLIERLASMADAGTTTVECKTGYGLDLDSELKQLQVLEKAKKQQPLTISSTYCGAHAVPKGSSMEAAARDVVEVQIPALRELCQSGALSIDNVDVFCEKGVFDRETSARILRAGQEAGWRGNFHGDELHPMEAGCLAAEVGACAVSHCERVSEAGMVAMAQASVTAVLLPTTAYMLRLQPPPARSMIEKGVAVALGSDFNPNAFCYSMPLVMHLACVLMHMSMPEALAAATINAAASLGLAGRRGSLEVGKAADMVIIKANRWEHMVYQFGCHDKIIRYVIKDGRVIVRH